MSSAEQGGASGVRSLLERTRALELTANPAERSLLTARLRGEPLD